LAEKTELVVVAELLEEGVELEELKLAKAFLQFDMLDTQDLQLFQTTNC
jgi:hypothetical protein